jgi:hypothetical protein
MANVSAALIGPCWKKVDDGGRDPILVKPLTIILDVSTTLGDIIRIDDSTSKQVAMHFKDCWFARYP